MCASQTALSDLDRRIVGALQVDGRASWRQIAAAIGEPERTIARRGDALLRSGVVTVIAASPQGEGVIVRVRCGPGMARPVGAALARRSDSSSCCLLTGAVDCFAEIFYPQERLASLALDEISGTPGVVDIRTDPITRYYRAVHGWQPGLITQSEATAITNCSLPARFSTGISGLPPLTREEQTILGALGTDGRMPYEALARLAGLSEPTARRRVQSLRSSGRAVIRAVIEPRLIGLPAEAMLWIRARPRDVDAIGEALAASPFIRYAAATMGEYQLVAQLIVADMRALHDCVTRSPWSSRAVSVETSLIVATPKRSGVLDTER
ncbi:Lrp/AsnC family transcriptional regulator [Nocardia vaccinii]|uniref:Lrp/AsnC family transcriptional regulator n=1 Tax=Nocardia vaccinii TaxID=1822 RepID=UPI000830E128|nr:AsnC family transcriptional regulator [Nocardia vaccinii]